MFESFKNALDVGPVLLVSHKDVFQKVDNVKVVLQVLLLLLGN